MQRDHLALRCSFAFDAQQKLSPIMVSSFRYWNPPLAASSRVVRPPRLMWASTPPASRYDVEIPKVDRASISHEARTGARARWWTSMGQPSKLLHLRAWTNSPSFYPVLLLLVVVRDQFVSSPTRSNPISFQIFWRSFPARKKINIQVLGLFKLMFTRLCRNFRHRLVRAFLLDE